MSHIYDIISIDMSKIIILNQCLKELKNFPREVQNDLLMVTEQLNQGEKLSMPLSRPMPSIGSGVHELRLKDRSGQYRVIYYYRGVFDEIYFLHAFKKTTEKTPKKNIDLAQKRLGDI